MLILLHKKLLQRNVFSILCVSLADRSRGSSLLCNSVYAVITVKP